jgi:hypothetical protein
MPARLAGALLVALTFAATSASPALAASPPTFGGLLVHAVYATRAAISLPVQDNGAPIESSTNAIATDESGPWTSQQSESGQRATSPELVGLAPSTTYYVRFTATNSAGTGEAVASFVTPAPEAPVIGSIDPIYAHEEGESTEELGPTYVASRVDSIDSVAAKPRGIEANGAATRYEIEYAPAEAGHPPAEDSLAWHLFEGSASGTIEPLGFAEPEVSATGLTPGTEYFARIRAENGVGAPTVKFEPFTTPSLAPSVLEAGALVGSVTADSAVLHAQLRTHGVETYYDFEYTREPQNAGSWRPVGGAEGTLPAEPPSRLFDSERARKPIGVLGGLAPGTSYYIRLHAENAFAESTSTASQPIATQGAPAATTSPVVDLDGERLRVLGSVAPGVEPIDDIQTVTVGGAPTGGSFTLTFAGQATAPISYAATPTGVREALAALSSIGNRENLEVIGEPGGPYTVVFQHELGGAPQPELQGDGSGLAPSGSVTVSKLQAGGGYDAAFDVEYVSEEQFARSGWGGAAVTPSVDLGAGGAGRRSAAQVVETDLPGLAAGAGYRYRVVATNTTPGDPSGNGQEQTLTVPSPVAGEAGESCPNAAERYGLSAHLPDCRAYEQVTPANKGGTMDIFSAGTDVVTGVLFSEDGEHVYLQQVGVVWGSSPDPTGNDNYVFTRMPTGWQMRSFTPEGATGPNGYRPELLSANLGYAGIESGWSTNVAFGGENKVDPVNRSAELEYLLGPPGGPYKSVATIPRSEVSTDDGGPYSGWIAGSATLGTAVLEVEDHRLLGRATGTTSGFDLYQYDGSGLRQVNVLGGVPGSKISSCGAQIAAGSGEGHGQGAAPGSVSSDGSRILFTDNCTHHLYDRVDGVETVDVGEYSLVAASSDGEQLLLGHAAGGKRELVLYELASRSYRQLLAASGSEEFHATISPDFATVYVESREALTPDAPPGTLGLYSLDVKTGALTFLIAGLGPNAMNMSADGKVAYFFSDDIFPESEASIGLAGGAPGTNQLYRLDLDSHLIQCVSCAGPGDPVPATDAQLPNPLALGGETSNGSSAPRFVTASGDRVFFEGAGLLAGDEENGSDAQHQSVYEWRPAGAPECSRVQGCLSLISSGQGGAKLLGIADGGNDVFLGTHESLVSQDKDSAGDVYDARVGGGFPPPAPGPGECEGDACQAPPPAPSDQTPASLTFTGAGNILQPLAVKPTVKSTKPKPKKKQKKLGGKRKKLKGRKTAGGRGKAMRSSRGGK